MKFRSKSNFTKRTLAKFSFKVFNRCRAQKDQHQVKHRLEEEKKFPGVERNRGGVKMKAATLDEKTWMNDFLNYFLLLSLIVSWSNSFVQHELFLLFKIFVTRHGAVAQSIERPSRVPGRCNSTDWRGFEPRPQHKLVGKIVNKNNPSRAICEWITDIQERVWEKESCDPQPVS